MEEEVKQPSASTSVNKAKNYTKEMKSQVVEWYIQTKSVTEVQRKFCAKYRNGRNKNCPDRKSILLWYEHFKGMLFILKGIFV